MPRQLGGEAAGEHVEGARLENAASWPGLQVGGHLRCCVKGGRLRDGLPGRAVVCRGQRARPGGHDEGDDDRDPGEYEGGRGSGLAEDEARGASGEGRSCLALETDHGRPAVRPRRSEHDRERGDRRHHDGDHGGR